MSIHPLPVFEADADPHHRTALSDEEIYARLEPPKTIVVRFGAMKLVAEYPYDGDAKPGCGTKLVVRTHRGTEVAEMLTTTCENAGCAKSVTRQEMREYIENSGGKDYPFYTDGKVLRIAAVEDLNKQSAINGDKTTCVRTCRQLIEELNLAMKLVDVEPILGGELLTFYYMADERVDFRELVRRLAAEFKTRIEMRQVGARDEARLVADYERCGQHCCCKNFLKVLKPISMRAAKMQKATLDPLKISGRCGRLMCCLRYEDQTYRDLKKNLPHRKTRVGTRFGPGIVIDGKILVQLVLVKLEHNDEEIAVPVEELMNPDECPQPDSPDFEKRKAELDPDPLRGMTFVEAEEKADDLKRPRRRRGGRRSKQEQQDAYAAEAKAREAEAPEKQKDADAEDGKPRKKRRRRRRKRSGPGDGDGSADGAPKAASDGGDGKKKRRRRRGGRKRRGGGNGGTSSA